MRDFKLAKTTILMMIFTYVLAVFFGCISPQNSNMSDKQRFIEQIKHNFSNDDSIEFTAAPFAQEAVLSAVFPLDIKFSEDDIYVGDILYDKIKCISVPTMVFNDFTSVNKEVTDEECFEIIEKIKNAESCYMLETESTKTDSKKIAVYINDDVYYFLSFLPDREDQVTIIHYVNVK